MGWRLTLKPPEREDKMTLKLTVFQEDTQYIVVLTENNKSYVFYFKHYVSVEVFIADILRSYTYTHHSVKIA